MRVALPYGEKSLTVGIPDEANIHVVEPRFLEGIPDQSQAIREALVHPIACEPLTRIVPSSCTVGIVLNDITRATPYKTILPVLLEEINYIPPQQIRLFIATGTHRPNTDAELRNMLGDQIVTQYKIIQNDAANPDCHILLGTSRRGNPIYIHSEFMNCDVRILTGFIEPHFFAGFSGGGKAIMPGLAQLETIMGNHCAELIDDQRVTWGATEGNPLWEEIREAALMADPSFILNVTLNQKKAITGVFAGDFSEAHSTGCRFAKENAMIPVDDRFDIVITSNSGYPLDLNLYQSVKGMSAAHQIVKKGGSIIIAANCWDGVPEHGEYGRLLYQEGTVEQLLDRIRTPSFQCQDMWQAQIHARICKNVEVYFYSHNLNDDQIRNAFLIPVRTIDETVADLLDRYGVDARICVLPEGPQTIPFIPGSEGSCE
jgi:nickel-dependent lactate racemase